MATPAQMTEYINYLNSLYPSLFWDVPTCQWEIDKIVAEYPDEERNSVLGAYVPPLWWCGEEGTYRPNGTGLQQSSVDYALNVLNVNFPEATRQDCIDCGVVMRDLYTAGGAVSGAAGPPAVLEVDVLVSPFRLPVLKDRQFRIEPVLRAGFMPALRPGDVGGLQLHPSRHATMRVMGIDGTVKYATTNFALASIQKEVKENFSVVQTFQGTQLEFNKEKYRIYNFGMQLIDARNFDWDRAWELNWKNYIKGSVLAANKWRWYMLEGARLYGGYPLGYQHRKIAEGEPVTGINLQVYITDDIPLPDMNYSSAEGFAAGNGFYRWKGTYVEGMDVNQNEVPDYDEEPKPTLPEDVEYQEG